MTTVFHPHVPGERAHDQAECWQGLQEVAQAGYRVVHWPTWTANDYAAGLYQLWGTDSLLVVEHDVSITLDRVRELDVCSVASTAAGQTLFLCAIPYRRYEGSGEWEWSAYKPTRIDEDAPMVPVEDGDSFAEAAQLGCMLIRRPTQDLFRPEPGMTWASLASRLWNQYREQGVSIHLHWPPVTHRRWDRQLEEEQEAIQAVNQVLRERQEEQREVSR